MTSAPSSFSNGAPEDFFQTFPLCGPFSITAELPDMHTVIRYMEKQGLPDQGYYRLVRHPWYRQVQQAVCALTGWPETLLYPSRMLALHAVLECRSVHCDGRRVAVLPAVTKALEQTLGLIGLQVVQDAAEADHSVILLEPGYDPDTGLLPRIALFSSEQTPLPANASHGILPLCGANGDLEGAALCLQDSAATVELYERNKKRGAVLSTRHLARLTGHDDDVPAGPDSANEQALERLCLLEGAAYGALFSSGMHAVTTLLDLLKKPGKNHVVVVGHVYSDTHYLMSEIAWPGEAMTFEFLNSDESDRVAATITDRTFAVFVETLTNPLNEVPDLLRVIEQAQARDLPVLVDNTMASPFNCKPLEQGATAVIHSTTKYLSGSNLHGGGAVVTNDPKLSQQLHHWNRHWEIDLSPLEGRLLWSQMQDVEERMQRFNRNGLTVAEFLEQHPKVKTVYYSGLPSSPYYETACRQLQGGASVVSFLLHEEHMEGVTRFYNANLQPIRKAPTLGSNITLMCPYTLLTYYQKTDDYLKSIPLSRYLIRMAVGSEQDVTPVLEALERGLNEV